MMKCQSEAGEYVEELETEWGAGQWGGAQVSRRECWRRRPRMLSCREWPAGESPEGLNPAEGNWPRPHSTWGKACLTQCKRFSRWNRKAIKMPSKCGWICHPLERWEEISADTSLFSPRRRRHPRIYSVFVDQQNTSPKMKKIFSEMLFDRKLLNLVKKS